MDGDCDDTLTQGNAKQQLWRDSGHRAITLRDGLGEECGTSYEMVL